MNRRLVTIGIGSFALVPIVGCEILLISGHLDKADPRHRDEPIRVNDNAEAYPTVGDGNSDGDTDRIGPDRD
jgi:hypothetical protein